MSITRWIAEYEIVKRLRVGGMATLYLARRHGAAGFSRLAAMKVIHPHLVTQPKFVEMFVDEARICSQISHPNIVHVEEFGEVDGTHYLVMEYIEGCSVNELLQWLGEHDRRLPPELAAFIITQVARGLHAAHDATGPDGEPLDIVHRDITPSNILLSTAGHVKVIDFGIAKARHRIAETEAGFSLKGKYRYVAPEQATRAKLDRRTDVFALGVVFWELLTGTQLFTDDTHVGLFNRLQETVVRPPSELHPGLPPELDAIVLAMLQHAPENRPPSAFEVQRWLGTALPAAARMDAAELGAIVREVREHRRGRAQTEDLMPVDDGLASEPRRSRPFPTNAPDDYRIEVIPAPDSPTHPTLIDSGPDRTAARPIGPVSRSRKVLPFALAGVLVAGVAIGLLLGREDAVPASASRAATAPQEPVVRESPPSPATARETAAPALRDEPPRMRDVQVEPPPVSRAPTRVVAATPARKQTVRTTTAERTTPREVVAPVEVAPGPKSAARAKTIRAGKTTFVDASFDDAGNTATTTATPTRTRVKKTTIVTDFGN